MSVRSTRLAGPTLLGAGVTTLLTVPLGRTALIKAVRIVNTSEDTARVSACIGEFLVGHAQLWNSPVAGERVFSDTTDWCLAAEEIVTIAPSVGGVLVVTLTGALLGATS